uniref:Uncharacterized protein n=1 Tax=Helianthus annuus TaxID=4232 RepID=A0A251TCL4_HELAN
MQLTLKKTWKRRTTTNSHHRQPLPKEFQLKQGHDFHRINQYRSIVCCNGVLGNEFEGSC